MKKVVLSLVVTFVSLSASVSMADAYIYQCGSWQLVSHINDMNYDQDFNEIIGTVNGQRVQLFNEDFKMGRDRQENIPTLIEILGVKQSPAIKCYYRQGFVGAGGVG